MMSGDSFETVAITYSQPEATVILSMFAFYGIPAYPVGFAHARAMAPLTVALGGIQIRVHVAALAEARELLAEVAERPQAVRPRLIDNALINGIIVMMVCFLLGVPVPPTRTGSTYFLGRGRRTGSS
jgi:hypothetical protein